MEHVQWARDLARRLLEEPLPRRWAHSQGVAEQAESLRAITGQDADLLTAAAWLHDIGYSPALVKTGFHPLDGARYLRDVEQADERLCSLVAHHSCALIEADERGLADELSREFALQPKELRQALIYCDMTTGPDGGHLPVEGRLAEIKKRYGPADVVFRFIERAEPDLLDAVHTIEQQQANRPT
ncbi:HD domain-containing protein [Allonocardiopsis opalescens]|uniref:HD domain-containing protein n=1 Tax=Allonocardiopsis opalescens TaxID=1144618 RepID=UPI000D076CEE|nr:HD domain-containing protein [Allonocardiopsis opalescens]